MSAKYDNEYKRIAKDCREANIAFPEQLAEQFARVAKKLNEDWGKPAAAEYLHDLIFPARPGRRGFPPAVAEEILRIKNLHEEKYAHVLGTVWDPYEKLYQDTSGGKKTSAPSHPERPDAQPKGPSIYQARRYVATAAKSKYSGAVARMLPEKLREQLNSISASHSMSGPSPSVPAPPEELDELLLDAERLFEEGHMNSGSALLEQVTTIFADSSPFPYLRLLEIYFQMQRREDYDWVNQRLDEQFGCGKLDWVSDAAVFRLNLDRLAEQFLRHET